MLLLAACAPPPALDLPVVPPAAEHATGYPASRFIGPLAVAEPDCTADPASLLAEGAYGWRVITVEADHYVLPDGTRTAPYTGGTVPELEALTEKWASADAAVHARCGTTPETLVLVAVHGESTATYEALSALGIALGKGGVERARLLVSDPAPDTPEPVRRIEFGEWSYMAAMSRKSWMLFGNVDSIPPAEAPTLAEAIRSVADLGVPCCVVLSLGGTWGQLASGLDYMAGEGALPSLGLTLPAPTPDTAPPPAVAPFRLSLDHEVATLRVPCPSYLSRAPDGSEETVCIGER